jgi:hypothetical protein
MVLMGVMMVPRLPLGPLILLHDHRAKESILGQ